MNASLIESLLLKSFLCPVSSMNKFQHTNCKSRLGSISKCVFINNYSVVMGIRIRAPPWECIQEEEEEIEMVFLPSDSNVISASYSSST